MTSRKNSKATYFKIIEKPVSSEATTLSKIILKNLLSKFIK